MSIPGYKFRISDEVSIIEANWKNVNSRLQIPDFG